MSGRHDADCNGGKHRNGGGDALQLQTPLEEQEWQGNGAVDGEVEDDPPAQEQPNVSVRIADAVSSTRGLAHGPVPPNAGHQPPK